VLDGQSLQLGILRAAVPAAVWCVRGGGGALS
jgi:hypothetical protein